MLDIPTGRRGSFLNTRMSYLKFKFTNTGTDAGHTVAADYNIASIFSRQELYHGSNLLEQIYEYGTLVTLWHDMTGSLASHGTTSSLLGGRSDCVLKCSDWGNHRRQRWQPSLLYSIPITMSRR